MALIYGQLVRAQLENSASDLTPVATGLVYYNTTTGPKWYNGSVWLTAADLTSTQTFSGKAFTSGTIDSSVIGGSTPAAGTFTTATATTSVSAPVANITGTAGAGYINAAEQSSTPATPSSGFSRIYPKSDNKWYVLDDNGVESPLGSGAGGSGEKTYVTNPSGETDAAGWADSGGGLTVVRTTTASELPRENTTGTGLKIAAGGGIGVGDYVYYDFTLDDIDQNRKLNIKWAQKLLSTYAAGDLIVYIADQSSRATPLHTPLVSSIPGYDLDFDANGFDTATTATLSLVIKNVSLSSGEGIVISDVIVGPGTIQAVPAVGTWQSYTSTLTGFAATPTQSLFYKRNNDSISIRGSITVAGANSGNISFTIPSGLTINTSRLGNGVDGGSAYWQVGYATVKDDNTNVLYSGTILTNNTSTNDLVFVTPDGSGAASLWGAAEPIATWAASDTIEIEITDIAINEWAGAPNYAGSNDVEYVYNSSTSTTTDSTSFGYGPSGAAVQAFAPSATSSIFKRIRFPTPMQATDIILLQFKMSNGGWVTASDALATGVGFYDGTSQRYVGTQFYRVTGSTTDIDVYFFSGAYWNVSGVRTWSSYASDFTHWRVVKAKAGAAVGFGIAKGGNSGLISYYDEGTFTPTVTTAGTAFSTVTYTQQSGTYTRIGRMVNFRLDIQYTSTGSPTGQLRVAGLPFAAGASAYVCPLYSESIDFNAGALYATAVTVTGQTYLGLVTMHDAANSQSIDSALNTGATSRRIQISGCYHV